MHKGFFAETLRQRPVLFRAMLQANRNTGGGGAYSLDIPPAVAAAAPSLGAWLAQGRTRWTVSAPAEGAAAGQRAAGAGFSDAAQGETAADGDFSGGAGAVFSDTASPALWDYAEESRRLCLVPASALASLAVVAGVALHATDIARVVEGEACRTLKDSLGEGLYAYALYRGQYTVGRVRELFAPLHPLQPLAQRCVLHGHMALHCVAQYWPEAYASRFAALAPVLPQEETCPRFTRQQTYALWLVCKKILLREVLPSWAPCFD